MKTESNVYAMEYDVGAHISFSREMFPTVKTAVNYGMYSFQFFLGNPKSCTRSRLSNDDISKTNILLKRFPMNVFTHFPYTANLNGSADCLAWNGNKEIDKKLSAILSELEYEINAVSQFKTETNRVGVVIHPGCYPDRDKGHAAVAASINKINFENGAKLLLENCAGEGRKLCRTFEEIGCVFRGIEDSKKGNVGVCVDTAHIWGQGDYDLRRCEEVDRMFFDFDRFIGLDRFTLLHLNDSMVDIGSKKDRHACLLQGYIWGRDYTSLIYLLSRCRDLKIPAILETHGSDMLTVAMLQKI